MSQLSPEPAADLSAGLSALRCAVRGLAPEALATFDSQHRHLRNLSGHGRDPAPVRMFLRRRGVFVELRRRPRRAARPAELELTAAEAADGPAARAAAQEIARILDGGTRHLSAP